MVYVDTSVLVAYYCPEASSVAVQEFLIEQPKPAISSLTEVEFTTYSQDAPQPVPLHHNALAMAAAG